MSVAAVAVPIATASVQPTRWSCPKNWRNGTLSSSSRQRKRPCAKYWIGRAPPNRADPSGTIRAWRRRSTAGVRIPNAYLSPHDGARTDLRRVLHRRRVRTSWLSDELPGATDLDWIPQRHCTQHHRRPAWAAVRLLARPVRSLPVDSRAFSGKLVQTLPSDVDGRASGFRAPTGAQTRVAEDSCPPRGRRTRHCRGAPLRPGRTRRRSSWNDSRRTSNADDTDSPRKRPCASRTWRRRARVDQLQQRHGHGEKLCGEETGTRSTRIRNSLRSGSPISEPESCRASPSVARTSRTAVNDSVGGKSQVTSLVTAARHRSGVALLHRAARVAANRRAVRDSGEFSARPLRSQEPGEAAASLSSGIRRGNHHAAWCDHRRSAAWRRRRGGCSDRSTPGESVASSRCAARADARFERLRERCHPPPSPNGSRVGDLSFRRGTALLQCRSLQGPGPVSCRRRSGDKAAVRCPRCRDDGSSSITTGAANLVELSEELAERDIVVVIAATKAPVRQILNRTGATEQIGSKRHYPSVGGGGRKPSSDVARGFSLTIAALKGRATD